MPYARVVMPPPPEAPMLRYAQPTGGGSAPCPPAAPFNSVAPSITGTVRAGETVTAALGTWADAVSYAQKWLTNGEDGATTTTLNIPGTDAGKTLRLLVTATNSAGSAQALSAAYTILSGGDVFFADVQLLLHGNGANGGTTFSDSSSFARTSTATLGTPTTSTTKVQFGTAGIRLAGSQVLGTGTATDWSWMHQASAKWTWEAWVSIDSFSAERALFSTSNGSTANHGLYIAISTSRGLAFQIFNGSGNAASSPMGLLNGGAGAFPNDTNYHHIAIQWDQALASNNLTWYVDGVLASTHSKTANAPSAATATATLKHGGYASLGTFIGYMDDIRLTKNRIRYTSTFTPPTTEFANSV